MAEKTLHSIEVECFCYPTEDKSRVLKALSAITGGEKPAEEKVESYYGPTIIKLTYTAKKQPEIKKIIKTIREKTGEKSVEKIIKTIKDRTDEEGNVFIRYSKQSAYEDKLILQYSGDIIHVKIKGASYPFSLKKIEENVKQLLSE